MRLLPAIALLFTTLLVSPVGAATPARQPVPAPGSVVQLAGTPHLWVADTIGGLHWGGDTRALRPQHVDWSYHVVLGRPRGPVWPTPATAESAEVRWFALGRVDGLPLHPGFAVSWPALRARVESWAAERAAGGRPPSSP